MRLRWQNLILIAAGIACLAAGSRSIFAATDATAFTYRGVAYISYQTSEYQLPDSGASLTDLRATGANWASLLSTWFMDSKTASTIHVDTGVTPTDAALVQAISDMHARGLRVMLKPQVDIYDGTFRGTIAPADIDAWFASYNTFIMHFAALAQAQHVDLFCIGCELKTMTPSANAARWATIIQNIRAVYTGPLTYAANAFQIGDEYLTCSFWPLLDIAGLDVYCPLTSKNDPTVSELTAAWRHDFFGQDMVLAYRTWQASLNQPVMFTEIGYQSAQGTNITPYYVNVATAVPDQQEQANCYEAAFEVFAQEPWLKGMFWWGWKAPVPASDDRDYTARGKLAAKVLRFWYTGANSAPTLISAPLATPSNAAVLQDVVFTAAAFDAEGDTISYLWNFGDGTTAPGSSVTHAFAADGTYAVLLVVSDERGKVTTAWVSVVVGTGSSVDPFPPPPLIQPLKIKALKLKLDFQRAQHDQFLLRGTLPNETPLRSTSVIVNASGISLAIQLDARGRSRELTVAKPHAGSTAFTLKLNKADLAATLASSGFTSDATVKNQQLGMMITLIVNATTYQTTRTVNYTVRKGISGSAN